VLVLSGDFLRISIEKLQQRQAYRSLVSRANNYSAKKITSKPTIGLICLFIKHARVYPKYHGLMPPFIQQLW
jgi:hypothetical protein